MSKVELFIDGKLEFSKDVGTVVAPPVDKPPIVVTPPVTPAGTTVRVVNFPHGTAYNTVFPPNTPPFPQGDNEIVAWQFEASQLVGTLAGGVQIYSASADCEVCISDTPGAFDSPSSSFKCPGSMGSAGFGFVPYTRAAIGGYGKLPKPSAAGKYFMNVRKVKNPAYDAVTLSYFPLYNQPF